MTAAALDRGDFARWAACAALVLALHASAALTLARWHEPVSGDEGTDAVVVDLAPYLAQPAEPSPNDVAPGPLQQQVEPTPPPPDEQKPEAKVEEKVEPTPPVPEPEVVLPPEPVKQPDVPKEEPKPPAPETTAPKPRRPTPAQVASWHRKILLQIEQHKGYPSAAQARRQTGVLQLAFTLDRQGSVVASRVVQGSGVAALDQEAMATIRRAHFPPPPPTMPEETFDFTVPIRFNIR